MITIKARITSSWKDKIVGLIGKNVIEPIYFETRWGIHTFGVKEPIDVVILDEANNVVQIKENLKPNHIFLWNPKYFCVIELPISKNKVTLGEKIELILS